MSALGEGMALAMPFRPLTPLKALASAAVDRAGKKDAQN